MALVMFCNKCFGDVRDYSPIALIVWTQACMMSVKTKRPLHIDEFRHFMFEWHGIRKQSVDSNMRVLESYAYLLTHEVRDDVWVFPLNMEKEALGVVTVCHKNHIT